MSSLRKLIQTEIRNALTEEYIEPSEQIFAQAMKTFKANTGIITPMPTFVSKSKRYDSAQYAVDLAKELRTPLLKALYTSMELSVSVTPLRDKIGGYSFTYSLNWKHPNGGTNGYTLGTVFYYDGIYKWREG